MEQQSREQEDRLTQQRREHENRLEQQRQEQEDRFRTLAEGYNAIVTHYFTLVKATGNKLTTSRMACNRLRDRVESLVYHITEGQDGEGGSVQEALHLASDEAAEALQ